MSLEFIDLLFNVVVMLFWVRLWNRKPTGLRSNPYLAKADSMTQPVLDIFQGHNRSASCTGTAFGLWLALILFRGMALPWAGAERILQAWVLRLGFETLLPVSVAFATLPTCILFSFFSFAVFLFKVWGLSMLLLAGLRGNGTSSPVAEFLHILSKPLSLFKPSWQPGILLGYGTMVILLMQLVQPGMSHDLLASFSALLLYLAQNGVSAAAGIVNLLMPLQSLLLILIIGSWVSMFGGGGTLTIRCQEWLEIILHPFRRLPLHLGPFDLTPILAFIAFGVLHWIMNGPLGILRLLFLYLKGQGL